MFREITEKAKKFHARLDAMGLKYRDLLELEVLAHSLGDMGLNILLGYERGESWPAAAGQVQTERESETEKNPYWAIYPLPEDCQSLFVFAGAEQFDKCVKNGVIPLHDNRESPGKVRILCFIGYASGHFSLITLQTANSAFRIFVPYEQANNCN